MEKIQQGYWRPSREPAVAVPFGGRSAGHADFPPGAEHGTGTIHFINVYWGTGGLGGPLVNGKETVVPPGHIALHYPGDRISGYPVPERWTYRWMTLDGLLALRVVEAMGVVPPWPRYVGGCPEHLFDQMELAIRDVGPAAEYRASAIAYEILTVAARGETGSGETPDAILAERCRRRIEEHLDDPELSVQSLSRVFGVHRSKLSRVFQARTGIPPSEYILQLRLRRAFSLLRESGLSIKEIARGCGFADAAYFSRAVRAASGLSPRRLRGAP